MIKLADIHRFVDGSSGAETTGRAVKRAHVRGNHYHGRFCVHASVLSSLPSSSLYRFVRSMPSSRAI